MISVGGNFGQSMAEQGPVPTGEQTTVPSGSASVNEGLFVQREENDSEEVRAERGEGSGMGIREEQAEDRKQGARLVERGLTRCRNPV
jgi:hypothetical protein